MGRRDASDNSKGGNGGDGATSNREVVKPKTRGKPPKKCLAESPPHEEDRVGDMKAESMKFAAAIRAEFESSNSSTAGRSSIGASSTSSPINTPVNSNNSSSSAQSSKAVPSSLRDVRIPRE